MRHQLGLHLIGQTQPMIPMRLLVLCCCLGGSIGLALCGPLGEVTIASKAIYVKDKSETNKSQQLIGLEKLARQREEEEEGGGGGEDLIDLANRLITADGEHQEDELIEAHDPLGQSSDNSINDNNSNNQKRQSADIKNLLDVDNSTLNAAVNPEQSNVDKSKVSPANSTINELEGPFLSLFDELWRIKNTTAIALIRLDYLQLNETVGSLKNETTTNGTSQQEEAATNNQTNRHDQCAGGRCNYFISQQLPGKRFGPLKLAGPIKLQNKAGTSSLVKQQQQQQPQTPLTTAVGQFNGWLAELQRRVSQLMGRLYSILVGRLIKQQPLRTATLIEAGDAERENRVPVSMTPSTENDQRSTSKKKRQTTNELDNPKGPPELESSDDSSRGDMDRTINNSNNNEASSDENCINLTIDEELRCKSTETLIDTTLNHSFPGTAMSIETNCAHVTFLLASCWPQQLQQLKTSIASWNETLLTLTEFPLPIGSEEEHNKNYNNNNQQQQQQQQQRQSNSCGFKESKSNQTIKDRVNWMWLNLCLDRKFRQDYLDNLRCLSLWSQERAQQVCSHEYRRMQAYLVTQSEVIGGQLEQAVEGTRNKNRAIEAKRRAEQQQSEQYFHQQQQLQHETSHPPSNMDNFGGGISIMDHLSSRGQYLNGTGTLPSRLVDPRGQPTGLGNNGNSNGNGISPESAQMEREVSSKMLCCMFDQFLRCFNRQAIRDCGRTGAQFVVNFMSRIGTDDMKYLCNSESRTTPTGSSRTPIMATTTTMAAAPNHKQSSSPSGSRRMNNNHHQHHINDKGPFIENNYCSDPRIQNALFGLMGAQHGGENRNKGLLSSNNSPWQGHQVGGRGKTRNHLINVNHDPTFFGTELATDSASWTGQGLIALNHYVLTLLFIIPSFLIVVI